MINIFKKLFGRKARPKGNLNLGLRVIDGEVTRQHIEISKERRTMHVALLGKSGSGKSSLLRYLSQQDINTERGFLYFDLHADAMPVLFRTIPSPDHEPNPPHNAHLPLIHPAHPT